MNSLFPVFVVEGEGEATKSSPKVNRNYGNVFYTIGEAQLVTIFLIKENKMLLGHISFLEAPSSKLLDKPAYKFAADI